LGIKITSNISEKELIFNRLGRKIPDNYQICAKHRYNLGIKYRPMKNTCLYPSDQKHSKHFSICPISLCQFLNNQFEKIIPYGSYFCASCKREAYKIKNASERNLNSDLAVHEPYITQLDDDISVTTCSEYVPQPDENSVPFSENSEHYDCSSRKYIKAVLVINKIAQPSTCSIKSDLSTVTNRYITHLQNDFQTYLNNCISNYKAAFVEHTQSNFDDYIMHPTLIKMTKHDKVDNYDSKEFENLKLLYSHGTKKTKIQILSIVSVNYSRSYLMKEFNCTQFEIDKSTILAKKLLW